MPNATRGIRISFTLRDKITYKVSVFSVRVDGFQPGEDVEHDRAVGEHVHLGTDVAPVIMKIVTIK